MESTRWGVKTVEGRNTVLVVDDDPEILNLLKVWLPRLGFSTPILAEHGPAAIETLCKRQQEIRIALIDLEMPYMSGCQAARLIRDELRMQLPLIALTTSSLLEAHDQGHAAGFESLIIKPFDFASIQCMLNKYLIKE
jgi:CheY-like chemotaxis protein